MAVCVSSGTGVGKSNLLLRLPDRIPANPELSKTLIERLTDKVGRNYSNMDMFYESIRYLNDHRNYVVDRSPIDYLVGSLLLGEITLREATYEVEVMSDTMIYPMHVYVAPHPPIEVFNANVAKKSSRKDFWNEVFQSKYSDMRSHMGAKVAHSTIIELSKLFMKMAKTDSKLYLLQPITDDYYSWTNTAFSSIINITRT